MLHTEDNDFSQADNRKLAAAQAKDESDRGDMEQHAHKLIRGFEKLNEAAARKAVWELVQNACDLAELKDGHTNKECCVTFDFRGKALAFEHNGKPFTSHTLLSLIKQVSGGKRKGKLRLDADGERPPVGQFGTGFITTHAFGRCFHLDSTLSVGLMGGPPMYVPLERFPIDRTARDVDELADELLNQHKRVFALVENGKQVAVASPTTTFRYLPDGPVEMEHVETAYRSLLLYMPLVMALNEPLKVATLISESGQESLYQKGDWELMADGVWQIPITCNDEVKVIRSLRSANDDVWVILPLGLTGEAETLPAEQARLFMFFPLVGTEKWGCEFLVHSRRFAPLEPRDGLHLELGTPQTEDLSLQNRKLLLEASELVFAFVEQAAKNITNPIRLARVGFGEWPTDDATEQADFVKKLQRIWVEKFRTLPLVETLLGRRPVENCWFLSPDLLKEPTAVDAIHAVVAKLWGDQVPIGELTTAWTEIVHEWQDENTHWVGPEQLALKLQEAGELGEIDPLLLRQVYDYLLAQGQARLFDHYCLLPTGAGNFKAQSAVKKPLNLVPQMVDVLRRIVPEVAASFVHPFFADIDLVLDTYGRSQLGKDVNERTQKIRDEDASAVTEEVRQGLWQLNSIYPTEALGSASPSTRRRLMPIAARFYEADYTECIVPNVKEDELDYERTPFKTMLRVFLTDFEKKYRAEPGWAIEALPLLRECLVVLAPSEQHRELMAATPVFPNQNGQLCLASSLVVETEFAPADGNPKQLKDWYKQVMRAEIQEKLVDPDFVECQRYFKIENLTGKIVAANLETELAGMGKMEEITTHPRAATIVDIIIGMGSATGWSDYFKHISAQKASIMLAKISDEKVKDDLFGIIGLEPDEIAQLGLLAREGNMAEIIKLGKEAIQRDKEKDSDFEYKKFIGVGIENLIRERLQSEVVGIPVVVCSEQGGQDIMVLLADKIVYRVEVKSRWRPGPATLSHLQAITAAANSARYALCYADLVTYTPDGEYNERYEVDDVAKIEDRICFVTDIGLQVEALISNVRAAEIQNERVKLAEAFSVAVPKAVTDRGISFSAFVRYLRDLLVAVAAEAATAGPPESSLSDSISQS